MILGSLRKLDITMMVTHSNRIHIHVLPLSLSVPLVCCATLCVCTNMHVHILIFRFFGFLCSIVFNSHFTFVDLLGKSFENASMNNWGKKGKQQNEREQIDWIRSKIRMFMSEIISIRLVANSNANCIVKFNETYYI